VCELRGSNRAAAVDMKPTADEKDGVSPARNNICQRGLNVPIVRGHVVDESQILDVDGEAEVDLGDSTIDAETTAKDLPERLAPAKVKLVGEQPHVACFGERERLAAKGMHRSQSTWWGLANMASGHGFVAQRRVAPRTPQ
jgi:hypothetical protein